MRMIAGRLLYVHSRADIRAHYNLRWYLLLNIRIRCGCLVFELSREGCYEALNLLNNFFLSKGANFGTVILVGLMGVHVGTIVGTAVFTYG